MIYKLMTSDYCDRDSCLVEIPSEIDLEKEQEIFNKLLLEGIEKPSNRLEEFGYQYKKWTESGSYNTIEEAQDYAKASSKRANAYEKYQELISKRLIQLAKQYDPKYPTSELKDLDVFVLYLKTLGCKKLDFETYCF